jgi:hypothetical protein
MSPVVPEEVRGTLLSGLLSWLVSSAPHFDPPQEDEVSDAPERIEPGRGRKAYGELGLALLLAQRSPRLAGDPSIEALTEIWLDTLDRRRVFFDMDRRPTLFPLRVVFYATLHGLGHDDLDARAGIQRVLDRGYMDRRERSSWDKLDFKYYLDLAGLRHGFPSSSRLFSESSLAALPALPYATTFDFYALTHLVFGLSGFGEAPDLPRSAPDIDGYSSAALAICLAAEDWDLVGELLASRICLDLANAGIDRAAALALADAQDPKGFIPGRALKSDGSGELSDREFFLDVYHPTLVCLILLACEASRA